MKEEALKLADELQDLYKYSIDDVGNRSADMIRKLVAELDKHQDKSLDELMKWQQELDKQGEPVAWMYERPNGAKKIAWVREPHDKNVLKEIPLYTAPQTTVPTTTVPPTSDLSQVAPGVSAEAAPVTPVAPVEPVVPVEPVEPVSPF